MIKFIKLVNKRRKALNEVNRIGQVIDYVWSWEGQVVKSLARHIRDKDVYRQAIPGYIFGRFVMHSGWLINSLNARNADLTEAQAEFETISETLLTYPVWKWIESLILRKEKRENLSNRLRWQGLVYWYQEQSNMELLRRPEILQEIHRREDSDSWTKHLGQLTQEAA